jgi:hypothetical protein
LPLLLRVFSSLTLVEAIGFSRSLDAAAVADESPTAASAAYYRAYFLAALANVLSHDDLSE